MKNKQELFAEELQAALQGKISDRTVRRPRRIYCKATADILDITKILFEKLKVTFLCTITGLDNGAGLEVMYHFSDDESGVLFTINVPLSYENAELNSITPIIPGAVYYERELVDMLGIKVKGVPAGNRYPLPDEFLSGQHPLRKNWSAAEYIKAEDAKCQK